MQEQNANPRLPILALGALLLGLVGGWIGQDIEAPWRDARRAASQEVGDTIDVAREVSPAVVSITGERARVGVDLFGFPETERSQSAGTGFIVRSDGLIVTNKHVVQGSESLRVLTADGDEFEAKVTALDPSNDLALIKIEAKGLKTVKLGSTENLEVGSSVVAIGNALGHYQGTVTEGVVSAIGRAIVAGDSQGSSVESLDNVLQTDAAINPGNSGGPLVDRSGQVVGINVAVDQQGEGIGFALPIEVAKSAIKSYERHGAIKRPLLGVRYRSITAALAKQEGLPVRQGALVGDSGVEPAVVSGSPAQRAGLREGDIITRVGNKPVDRRHPLSALIQEHQPGDRVAITYLRDGRSHTTRVTLSEVPQT
jgi:serine protease Do